MNESLVEQVDALHDRGIEDVKLNRVLSPPWTTDWITAEGREKLRQYGIAPPAEGGSKRELLYGKRSIACPRCASDKTEVVSEFGSTACNGRKCPASMARSAKMRSTSSGKTTKAKAK